MNNQVPLAAVRYVVVDPMSLALALCCREETPNTHDHPKLQGWILKKIMSSAVKDKLIISVLVCVEGMHYQTDGGGNQ